MLSFDISAIDVVLLTAVIILLILSIQKRGQASTIPQPPEQERLPEKIEAKSRDTKKRLPADQSPKGFRGCAHSFGYLKDLPKNTPVPDECFGCPQVMRCLFTDEQDQLAQ